MADEKLSGYCKHNPKHKWIRVVTTRAQHCGKYLRSLSDDVLILSIAPVTIQGQAYRRIFLDIRKYEMRDVPEVSASGFDFRKMLREKPIRPRK